VESGKPNQLASPTVNEGTCTHQQRTGSGLRDGRKSRIDFLFAPDGIQDDFLSDSACCRFYFADLDLILRKVRIVYDGNNFGFWNQFTQQREPFANNWDIKKTHPGNIATGSIDAGHEARYHRIGSCHENDWNTCRSRLRCQSALDACDDRRHLKADKLSSKFWQPLLSARPPTATRLQLCHLDSLLHVDLDELLQPGVRHPQPSSV
jgi:hypothetical protein